MADALTPEQLQRMKDLFAAALQLDAGRRAEYLAEAYRRDATLRAGVQSIITRADAGDIPSRPPAAAPAPASMIGRRIGPYEIVREIGKGGMGVVYLAVRADEAFRKQVAIKLLRAGPDSDEILRRFRTERQILAALDHPNIVKLLDGGTTEDGMPHFVMDHVEGVPIDVYCDRQKLRTPERLRLFLQVCAAVHYAHQRLIVHRDLKPSNILVTPEGVPKLLDFGIAKLMKPGLMAEELELTGVGVKLMTPEYASPEQVRGDPITTATDIYALGVILYELLTGRRPYNLKNAALAALMLAILETEPQPPSTAVFARDEDITPESLSTTRGVTPDHLSRGLRGDLDNIILMALRKEPSRRYSSVEQFGEDIRRHLDGLPVTAQKPTVRYRTAKFVRRHRISVAASALLVLSLLGGIASTAWQANVAGRERTRAERRYQDVRGLANAFLTELHDSLMLVPGATKPREILVRRGLEYLDKLAREAESDLGLKRELAAAYERMGDVQGNPRIPNLGDGKGALASYVKSLDLREALYRAGPNVDSRRDLMHSHMALGDIHWLAGRRKQSLESYRQALALAEQSVAEQPKRVVLRREVAMNLQNIGDLLLEDGDATGAAVPFEKSLQICEALARENPDDWRHRRDLALAHNKVGDVLWYKDDFKAALAHYQTALAERERLTAQRPQDGTLRRELLPSMHNVGDTLEKMGDAAGALGYFLKSLEVAKGLAAADPKNSVARRDLCLTHARIGGAQLQLKKYAAALESLRNGLEIARAAVAAEPESAPAKRDLGDALFNVAEAHERIAEARRDRTEWELARSWYRESLTVYKGLSAATLAGKAAVALQKCEAALAK